MGKQRGPHKSPKLVKDKKHKKHKKKTKEAKTAKEKENKKQTKTEKDDTAEGKATAQADLPQKVSGGPRPGSRLGRQ